MDPSPAKVYIERGIQTDPPRHLSRRSDDVKATNVHPSFPAGDGAYTQSSLDIPKRDNRLSQLPFQKPSASVHTNKRVVSLPETSPPQRIKPIGDRDRVASMSGQVKAMLTSSADNTISSDCFESSISFESSRSPSSGMNGPVSKRVRPRRSLRNSLILRTPSPPSSPESVMIIGNDMQVPSSFFRQKAESLPIQEEDDGWITWASSPPRPILALHGPLSLPYARCPSGAEGTIIEGEDMSRMIWGLDNDAAHLPASRDDRRDQEAMSQFNGLSSLQDLQDFGRRSGTVDSASSEKRTQERQMPEHSSNALQHPLTNGLTCENGPFVLSPTIIRRDKVYDPLPMLGSRNEAFQPGESPTGLGIMYQTSPGCTTNNNRHLKASAPIFVPGQQTTRACMTIDTSSRSHTVAPGRQLPAIDLAYEYRVQQQAKNSLPTPPNSSSIGWSPSETFSTPISVLAERPPNVLYCDDRSEELRRFIYERIGQQKFSPSDLKQISEIARSMERPVPPIPAIDRPSATSLYSPAIIDLSVNHPGPSNTPLLSVSPFHNDVNDKGFNRSLPFATGIPPSPESPVVDTGNQIPQLRSVPFARLLHRKLASVPEEESQTTTQNMDKPQRQIERAVFGGAAAQHYKPYFARTTATKVSRIPDIGNNAKRHTDISSATLEVGDRVLPSTRGNRQYLRPSVQSQNPVASSAVRSVLPSENRARLKDDNDTTTQRRSSSTSTTTENLHADPSTRNENKFTDDKKGDADTCRNAGIPIIKLTSKKKGKNKPKRQDSPITRRQSSESQSSEPWLSGPALEAWLT